MPPDFVFDEDPDRMDTQISLDQAIADGMNECFVKAIDEAMREILYKDNDQLDDDFAHLFDN